MTQSPITRVVLITGAAGGIGRSVSLRLASDGFNVALNDMEVNKQQLENLASEISKATDGKCKTTIVTGDVSMEDSVANMIQKTVEDLGSLDVMIANAGICISKSFMDTSLEDWERIFAINARGTFLCYKYAAKQMIAQGHGGRIIGASSVAGKQAEPGLSAYSSTKFSVRGITQAAANELGQYGITVNAYAPGAIETEMLRGISDVWYKGDFDAMLKSEGNRVPSGRAGRPTDVANLVSFLASSQSDFITGQSLSVNGGRFYD